MVVIKQLEVYLQEVFLYSSGSTTIEFVNFATTGDGTDYGDTHTGLQNVNVCS